MERLTYNFSNIITELSGTSRFFNKLSRGTLDVAVSKLRDYEDAAEAGLLIRLPCKVGATVYFIKKTGFHPELIETSIDEVGVRRGGMFIKLACNSAYRTAISALGKTVFLTREEAESALAKEYMGGIT